ncbi:protein AATF [Erpetoichthys calabaricus]|uniref:Apoptosis antagonizing transcription factor n=1 Tax=Erpetoichthys calabaricus TaxID=27687 RepID=A0A8C4X6M0_ERPCA|nr:protein AATF [Erpetoichthys calabaricus]
MAAPISLQLQDLLNPLPKFHDPEDDEDEATKAKVIETFDEGENDEGDLAVSSLRSRASLISLLDIDRRYSGRATTRKELLAEAEDSGEENESQEDIETLSEENSLLSADYNSELDESNEGVKVLDDQMKSPDHKPESGKSVSLGSSVEEDEDESENEKGSGDSEEDNGDEDVEESGNEDDQESNDVKTFSEEHVNKEVEKGKAVKDQLILWDQILEGRIKLQKALLTGNRLPEPNTFPVFKKMGGSEFAAAQKNAHKALKALQRSLLELQDELFYQHPDTKNLVDNKESTDDSENDDFEEQEEEVHPKKGPPKRKLETSEFPEFIAKRFKAFQKYRNSTLQKWHDKTRLSSGKIGKAFSAFDRNMLSQIDQIMMAKDRLLKRTQTKRSMYRVLGDPEPKPDDVLLKERLQDQPESECLEKNATSIKEFHEEIFDDDDFYHQLLRELIERKTSAVDPNDQVAMGRQWLAIQRLRSKIKKRVDTKASKGRKVRFHVHSKLVNFMAPIAQSPVNDDAWMELYKSLFGKTTPATHPVDLQTTFKP